MSATNNPCDLLLDTHVWVRYINGTPGLRPETVTAIETARRSGDIFVSVISIWEVALLVKKKRLNLPMPVERWVEQAMRLPGVQLLPLTPEIAMQSVQLPDSLNRDGTH
jgi:PIN domain nuclease of toxin-antitoxin system